MSKKPAFVGMTPADFLNEVQYRDQRACNASSPINCFDACEAYFRGENVWHQREYGRPPEVVMNDKRGMARISWLMNNPLSLEVWTNINLPMAELKILADKYKGRAVEHFYGPEGRGFLAFDDTETAAKFLVSSDYPTDEITEESG